MARSAYEFFLFHRKILRGQGASDLKMKTCKESEILSSEKTRTPEVRMFSHFFPTRKKSSGKWERTEIEIEKDTKCRRSPFLKHSMRT